MFLASRPLSCRLLDGQCQRPWQQRLGRLHLMRRLAPLGRHPTAIHSPRAKALLDTTHGISCKRSLSNAQYSKSPLSFQATHSIVKVYKRALVSTTASAQNAENIKSVSAKPFPTSARVVIGGGGVVGCSVAYHLAKAGWTDVVLLEQGSLACGTTWHAAGLVGRMRSSSAETAICLHSAKLYRELDEQGYSTGWKECGSLNLCRTKDRLIAYKRYALNARRQGIEVDFLTPKEVQDRLPLLRTDDIQGGLFIHGDGTANPTDVAMALSRRAKEMGVQIVEGCKIQRVLTEDERVSGVETDHGSISCEVFVNTAGQWARELGKLSDPSVRVPLHSCEHFYIVTKGMPGVPSMMPVVRDYDGFVYLREWSGGLLAGGFEPIGKPVFHEGIPEKFEFQLLPEDWDHFQVLLEQMLHRVPTLADAEVRQMTNGPESFTPDGRYILGEAPEVDNYFVAAGMNSSGIAGAGGIGKFMSEWIINKDPGMDFWGLDVRRFVDLHNNIKFLKDRVKETLGQVVSVHYWDNDMVSHATGRKLRTSPVYTRTEQHAVFGQSMGYERPVYFKHTSQLEEADETCWFTSAPLSLRDYSSSSHDFSELGENRNGQFGKPQWFDKVKSEYWACREGVCLIDMSTFTKFELRSAGSQVVDFLQYVCSNDVDRHTGTVVHTGMQNHHGGYENDCSVIRMADNRYFMVCPTAQQTRCYAWLKDHLPKDGSVQLSDVTSMYTAINVIGPKAQELLAELTDTPLSKQEFMHMTCKEINVGQASGIKAMRLTHSGEDGWLLYIPSEYALHVYDSLMSAGKNYGVRNAGYYALRALRTEKFFAYWGTDLTPYDTPLECGREYRVKLETGGFIGYPALLRQRNEGIKKRLVQFLVEEHDNDDDPWPWGGEPIFRNGAYCGTTTSTAYGYTLSRHVLLAYVQDIDAATGDAKYINDDFVLSRDANFEVDIAGQRFPVKARLFPPNLPSAALNVNATVI